MGIDLTSRRFWSAARCLPAIFIATLLPSSLVATNHILRQDEIMAGFGGDARVQFIEITVGGNDQKAWGPQLGEIASRAMLVFFDGNGIQTGTFFFPSNAPIGQSTVLIATTNFAALPGAPIPDFIIPPLLSPGSGKVCFKGNPANRFAFGVNLCLSYGNFPTALTEGAGAPAPVLPITGDPISLARVQNFTFGALSAQNASFTLVSPTPSNTRGQTMTFPVDGPEIDFLPGTLNFGNRDINAGATVPLTLIITNRGTVNPLVITNVTLIGTNVSQFNLLNDSGQTTLPPRGTRTLLLNFDPSSPGIKTATVRVVCNDTNETFADLSLRGVGVDPNAPEIDASPLFTFPNQNISSGLVIQGIGITNRGNIGALTISNFTVVGPNATQFRITSPTNATTIAPQGTRQIDVGFDPETAGPKNALLRIFSNDSDEGVFDVPIRGNGFDLNPCTAPNPTNSFPQNIAQNAQLACPGLIFTGTTLGSTPDGSSSCSPNIPDVWYRYVPATNGTLVVTATASQFISPLVLSAHSAIPGNIANQFACALTSLAQTGSPNAQITLTVTNGIEVFLRLAATATAASSFTLNLAGPPCFDFDRNLNGTTDSCELDFGDAPAPYPTTLATNGARHRAFSSLFLGQRIDPNPDGLPTPMATGDNLDGPPSDDDGVLFTSPLIVGQAASVTVTASGIGRLNAWIDFNADGDWLDAGEQVFTNRLLAAGPNALTFAVPAGATPTNVTFARYRFSVAGDLTPTGLATDGEVEDYAIEILGTSATPSPLGVRFNEVMAGLNGDSTIQFIELQVDGDASRAWGPQGSESVGRAMLAFFDEAGQANGRFVFPSNAPPGADTVLVATRAFAEHTGMAPDFLLPPEVMAIAGKVAFQSNPDNRHFEINLALAYGGNGYYGTTEGAGPANTNQLPILHARSLGRVTEVPFGLNQNAAFQLGVPSPRNTAGNTVALAAAPLRVQGNTLFSRETFRGNGRTCATCHVSGRDQFGLTPLTIAELPKDDPLFVFEPNVNVLRLTARSQPSDLRGTITGAAGNARILSGTGDRYLVIGGTNLTGALTDAHGNSGIVQTVTEGDLDGPTPSNGSQRGLEDHELLEHGRALILENIDGFKRTEVFRASPHLLNLALTSPFGLSGEFDNLEDFSDGAVVQHFPKSLARVSGIDFRHPTREELEALTAFMLEISNPTTNQLNLDRFATTAAQKRGRALFFGDEGRCSKCHNGPVLALSDGTLPGSLKDVNENFDTGVANILQNLMDGLPGEPAGQPAGESTRKFNTPPLFNIRLTAPFFHDGSAPNLTEAIKFYDTDEFHNSESGADVGSVLAANRPEQIADLVAFLESLVELPVEFTRELQFGVRCPGGSAIQPLSAIISNAGPTSVTITNVMLNGTHPADFSIASDTGQSVLGPGQVRSIQIEFAPTGPGAKHATLEITAMDTNRIGSFSFGVALIGADVDNLVHVAPTALNFGMRDIDAPPSPVRSIVITNTGSTELDISTLRIEGDINDFAFVTETNPIPPNAIRVMQVAFAPRSAGFKSARILIEVVACNLTLVDLPLEGIATSTVRHFAWHSFAATQFVGTPIAIGIEAQDRNNDLVESFSGTVSLASIVGGQTNFTGFAPTVSGPFVNGMWFGELTPLQTATPVRLQAQDNQGHVGLSAPFTVTLQNDLSLTVTSPPNAVSGGQSFNYALAVHNTGPGDAAGVVVTNTLAPKLSLVSAETANGSMNPVGNSVVWTLGTVPAGTTRVGTIRVSPQPDTGTVTNRARVSRVGPEFVLGNNAATNITLIESFGLLVVSPTNHFLVSGSVGGPFVPTNQNYVLSNAGTAPLTWSVKNASCSALPGLVAWWGFDGNTSDNVGTNTGTFLGNATFGSGFMGPALALDGIDDGLRIPQSPSFNVGIDTGFTIETWINPASVATQHPVVEWDNGLGTGTHFWISVFSAGGGSGSLFANITSIDGTPHHVSSAPGIVATDAWQHIAVTYTKSNGVATLFHNGEIVRQQAIGSFTSTTAGALLIGNRGALAFEGQIDETGIFNRDLAQTEIRTIFLAGAAGKCSTANPQPGPTNCSPPAGLAGWWRLDGTTENATATNVGTILGNPTFTNGFVGQALFFDGTDDGVRIPFSPNLKVGTNQGMTMEAWISTPSPRRRGPILEWSDGVATGAHLWIGFPTPGCLLANLIDGQDRLIFTPGDRIPTNTWTHVAVTYSRISGTAVLYLNGVAVQTQNLGIFTPRTDLDLLIGRRPNNDQESFEGAIDEPSIYGRELSAADIQSIFLAGSAGKCRNSSWLSVSNLAGTLTPGATANVSFLVNTNALSLDAGSYFDLVTFANLTSGRDDTTRSATLTVLNPAPTLDSITQTGGTVLLRWTTVPNRRYRVQFKSNLADAQWSEMSGDVQATGTTVTSTDTPAPSTQRFYRVKVVP